MGSVVRVVPVRGDTSELNQPDRHQPT